jgi:hypothetical protein
MWSCVYVVGPGSISGLMGWQRNAGHTQPWLPVGCGAGERVCVRVLGCLLTQCVTVVMQILSALGTTLTIVQAGATLSVPVEQVYAQSQTNVPTTLIVSMTIPNLQGTTAATPGTVP